MIPELRRQYNDLFTNEAYRAMLDWMGGQYGERPEFHIAETPVFVPNELRDQLLEACQEIMAFVTRPDFAERAKKAIPAGENVPGQDEHPLFIQLDFGLCEGENGKIIPQLVEGQGFPSLYFFQYLLDKCYRKFFPVPEDFTCRFNGYDEAGYLDLLRKCILGNHAKENVILLEVEPRKQKTRVDFTVTCAELGIEEVCISEVERDGDKLYYQKDSARTRIHRIYNRVIFDELKQRPDLKRSFNLTEDVDVEWAGHPNWFFLLSKHSLPFLKSKYVPDTQFVSDLTEVPADLEKYVLKPLYSFAGAGVNLHPTPEAIAAVDDPTHYILQKKVKYAEIIETPDGPARVEMRLMFVWPEDSAEPILVNNLVRVSKGEMIGVRYNAGKTWVGGAIGYFKP
ncbi:ATP-grasp domain-containing protein [Neolewinella antarctica]|uniref:Uncharacterized protein n=1 Tax=Neolewinella antarctica TaxID=442734 RepID=A0ABX0X7H4_9BACT|nr:hypothetical protein [Neolewinella antarctica]NJC24995.1 hypothetical protein [Neolewinella antarctica]